jgi:hypothetical protein
MLKLSTHSAAFALLAVATAAAPGTASAQAVCRGNECKATSGVVTIGPGDYAHVNNPACGDGSKHQVTNVIKLLGVRGVGMARYAGPVMEDALQRFGQGVRNDIAKQGGDLARLFSGVTNPVASCSMVPVKLPEGAQVTGTRMSWREQGAQRWGNAAAGETGAWSAFEDPACTGTPNGSVCHTVFKNWSHDRTREAMLEVYFTRPDGGSWVPQHAQPW